MSSLAFESQWSPLFDNLVALFFDVGRAGFSCPQLAESVLITLRVMQPHAEREEYTRHYLTAGTRRAVGLSHSH